MDRGTISRAYRRVLPRRDHHRKTVLLAVVLLIIGLIGFIAHFVTVTNVYLLGIVAVAPYLMVGALLGAILLLIARRWLALVLAVVLVALCVSTQSRLYTSTDLPRDPVNVTVMTSNLLLGSARPASVIAAVRTHRVDLLMLEELTSQEQAALIKAGLNRLFPYHVSRPNVSALGTGMWSRYPLRGAGHRPDFNYEFVYARVLVPGVRVPPLAVALHTNGPYPDKSAAWQKDITHLPAVLPKLAPGAPALVGGDFNATPDSAQFRAVLHSGFQDAADQAGAGTTRSYPSDRSFPPLIAIDHVLTRGAVAQAASTVQISGSDHRALLTTVAVPRS
ncbi:endonuclease/exonuclease/phosphatase family protein [uncultured Jatrophihabitans sp.]|uniref:endonuclease/exonuclease/phosphatase family protein n=1 Tax=uncultured Jatrophihabitans sp. TaxID=1610747 RepID=UPI0035CABF89